MKKVLLLLILLSALIACNKDENNAVFLLISPTSSHITLETDDIVSFIINCSSDFNLKNLKITSKDDNSYTKTELDTALAGKESTILYEYKAPQFYENTEVLFVFSLTDEENNQTQLVKIVEVIIDSLATETSGHEMFSHATTNFDAYNLLNGTPLNSLLADSSEMHIMDYSTDSVYGNTLSRKWVSPAGLKFVRFNDFDYGNATISTIKQAYDIGIKNDFIESINEEDIIITKFEKDTLDSEYIAVKIVYVIDNESINTDRYIFNIKH